MSTAITYRDILTLQTESGLSPEALADYLQVTNMTLRRWNRRDDLDAPVAPKYLPAIRDGLFRLQSEGKLSSKKVSVSKLVENAAPAYFNEVLAQMKINPQDYIGFSMNKASISALGDIGTNFDAESTPGALTRLLRDIKLKSKEFKREVAALVKFIDTGVGPRGAKVVAIGALVYLVMPMDLIPDSIPGIGLIDDFAFLTIAIRYCKIKLT